ncbi:MAG: OmpH family outer membrane protein [Muribaculaceae bacterium]|nr:OmpH family outer membrane protein [Muribaculaceae bacterium]
MKKLSYTVKTLVAVAFVAAACSCNDKQAAAPAAAVAANDSNATAVLPNFRYINADSVLSAYVLAQQFAEESQRELMRYQQQEQQKSRELETLGNSIQQKQQNNIYLSEASMRADIENFQKKQEEASRYLGAQQQRIQASTIAAQKRLNDSIQSFIKDYNAVKGYDAILLSEAGIYFNPALDITAEVIEGLNARFQASTSK